MSSTNNPQPSPIDVPLLLDRCMDDAALAGRILDQFASDAPGALNDLQACTRRRDIDALAARAHALKGTAGALAATELMNAAAALEHAARAATDDLDAHLATLERELATCLAAIPETHRVLGGA